MIVFLCLLTLLQSRNKAPKARNMKPGQARSEARRPWMTIAFGEGLKGRNINALSGLRSFLFHNQGRRASRLPLAVIFRAFGAALALALIFRAFGAFTE
jgi:hypothetical protein